MYIMQKCKKKNAKDSLCYGVRARMMYIMQKCKNANSNSFRWGSGGDSLGHLRSDVSHLADEGVDLSAPLAEGAKAKSKNSQSLRRVSSYPTVTVNRQLRRIDTILKKSC